MAATQRVTSDKTAIPAHYVQLSSYGCNARGKPATPAYQVLHHAWSARKLGGWKLMSTPTDQRGPIYVDPQEAEQILKFSACDEGSSETKSQQKAHDTPALLDAMTAFLGAIATNQQTLIVAVERIALAAEQIAKQPLARMDDVAIAEPSGTCRDMNGEAL